MKIKTYNLLISSVLILCFSCNQSKNVENKNEHIQTDENQYVEKNYWFSESDLYFFKENNIDTLFKEFNIDTLQNFVINNLEQHTELIPFEAILGGTMTFGNIMLLGHKWVIADFEDGHIGGQALYKYSINRDKSITWKLIDFQEY